MVLRLVHPTSSSIPGRRTLIGALTPLGSLTREVKYITPGKDKSWREKHEGIFLTQPREISR